MSANEMFCVLVWVCVCVLCSTEARVYMLARCLLLYGEYALEVLHKTFLLDCVKLFTNLSNNLHPVLTI